MSDALQNLTPPVVAQDDAAAEQVKLEQLRSYQQDEWISYCAVGGLITTTEDSIPTKMNIEKFAEKIGVSRQTLYTWKKTMPHFWDRVDQRRMELGSKDRLTKVINGVYLRAMGGNPEAAKIYLGIFAGWQPPAQRHDIEVGGGLTDLLEIARQRALQAENQTTFIEGEVRTDAAN